MNIQEYKNAVKRTRADLGKREFDEMHMAMGASTEANELLDIYKKWFAYGKPIDYINVEEEIFDSFWYLVNLCDILNIDIEKGFGINIEKLKQRYPEKFDQHHAINRDLDAERKILES